MDTTGPRRGIERKILTSILWIGIAPLGFALVAGYFTVRQWQGQAVKQALLTAAEKTATGLRITTNVRLNMVSHLSSDPLVLAALVSVRENRSTPFDPTQHQQLVELLRRSATSHVGSQPSQFALYDAQGDLLADSGDLPPKMNGMFPWAGTIREPQFVDVDYIAETNRYLAQAAAPVYAQGTGECIGYVAEFQDIQLLMQFAMGKASGAGTEREDENVYQVAYEAEGRLHVASPKRASDGIGPTLAEDPVDDRLAAMLTSPNRPRSDSVRIKGYRTSSGANSVFLAYVPLFEKPPAYVVVYRSQADIFGKINLGALGAAGFCIIVIVTLCLNAYRNVHNNIVRNVLLLNEGAQIIGQGDLELKLKIATGDEIEELATSFNKMALALKRNIRRLEESEEKYRSLVNSMRDGIVQMDPKGTIVLINPTGAEIFGFEGLEDVLGHNLQDLFSEAEELAAVIAALKQEGFVERSRVGVTRKDGRRICLEMSGNLLHDDAGRVVGIEGIVRDVTKGVQLEHEVRERAERIGAINQIANVINSSLQAGRLYESLVVEVKKLVDFDFASLSLLDESGDRFVMRGLWPEQVEKAAEFCTLQDEVWIAPTVARTQQCLLVDDFGLSDSRRPLDFPESVVSCLCVPLYATGRIIGTLNLGATKPRAFSKHNVEVMEQMAPHVAVAIRNAQLLENLQVSLNEATRAQEKVREAHEELKTLDEMKTNLLSNVSHELRTPLVAVLGYTDMIYNGKVGPINEIQKEYLGIGLRNIEKLVTLIENLLDFSRLHRGAETLVFDTFNLVDCVQSSMEIMRPVADSREISLELSAPDDPVLVEGDKGKLSQVFTNLLSNAVKFNHHGGSVIVRIRLTEDMVEASVSDTGIGIPAEALDRVFTRFYQYDGSSTRKYGGAGIGLSIAQDIARLHGTRIAVASEVGKGSVFTFMLPLKTARRGGKEGAPEPLRVIETHLLVELVTADRAFCTQVRTLLDSEGIDVTVAGTSTHAVELAQHHDPDCLIVDMETGRVSDAILDELASAASGREQPTVILTSDDGLYLHHSTEVTSRLKPGFRKSTLLSAIHYALGHAAVAGESLGKKILCVDDDPEVVTFISRCLEGEGFQVDHCSTGEQALRLIVGREYGLVLLDIAMPGIDGFETCRRIRSDPRLAGIKVYMVTAKPIESGISRAQETGFNGYLLKPFRSKDLIDVVHSAASAS